MEKTQWIKRVVREEVLTCQSSLVELLLEHGHIQWDDAVNVYKDNSDLIEQKQSELENLQDRVEDLETKYDDLDDEYASLEEDCTTEEEKELRNKMDKIEQEKKEYYKQIEDLEKEIEELEEEQDEAQEVYEWWVVSSWLADKLESLGEVVIRSDYETWWGRGTSGQAIEIDYIMQELYNSCNH